VSSSADLSLTQRNVHAAADIQESMDGRTALRFADPGQEPFRATERQSQRHRALVGSAVDEHAASGFSDDDAGRLEKFIHPASHQIVVQGDRHAIRNAAVKHRAHTLKGTHLSHVHHSQA
jgi:hypothetical protein